jgi:type I restriction enzyme S subunit
LNKSAFSDLEISLPQLGTQGKIAAVLSAYDDLIENNTRRIQILEEIAQTIYREWFVHFRFPGHENVRMVDSGTELGKVPEGWEVKKLASIADVIDCSHARKPQKIDGTGNILLHVWNVGEMGTLDLSKRFEISEEDYLEWSRRIEVSEGDCIISKTGRVGAVAQIPRGIEAALGRNLVGIRMKNFPTYSLQFLLSSHKKDNVTRLKSSGTIMESLHVQAIEKFLIFIPPNKILDQFEQLARPIRLLVELLLEKNTNLRVTRDILLPKLISGQIDVSELDI